MPKRVPDAFLAAVVDAVGRLPDGGSLGRIRKALGGTVPKRTLQRRLATLVQQGRLVREGQGAAACYRVPGAQAHPPGPVLTTSDERLHHGDELRLIRITPEAASVERLVRAPIQQRPPVGYNRAFLEDYAPGATWYLPADLRQRLRTLGRSPDHEAVAGTFARRMHERLLIDLSWNSSRLEGNTYSLLETARLLESGEPVAGRSAREAQMILNHKAAIDLLLQTERIGFNRYTILNLHALLADNLLPDPGAVGRTRSASVQIGGSSYYPLEVPQQIEECFDLVLSKAGAIPDPFEQAFFALVHLPYLQPFLDVNKRVSRLAANLPLVRGNFCPLSFLDVPTRNYVEGLLGVYERNRVELLRDVFSWAYERSCARYSVVRQALGEPDPFRLRHRGLIATVIRQIVQAGMGKLAAAAHIRQQAEKALPIGQRDRLIEVVETELLNLHEGNVARLKLSLDELAAWQMAWRSRRVGDP